MSATRKEANVPKPQIYCKDGVWYVRAASFGGAGQITHEHMLQAIDFVKRRLPKPHIHKRVGLWTVASRSVRAGCDGPWYRYAMIFCRKLNHSAKMSYAVTVVHRPQKFYPPRA